MDGLGQTDGCFCQLLVKFKFADFQSSSLVCFRRIRLIEDRFFFKITHPVCTHVRVGVWVATRLNIIICVWLGEGCEPKKNSFCPNFSVHLAPNYVRLGTNPFRHQPV